MSLINEALKKAQRVRTEDQAATAGPPTPGAAGASIPKRAQARSANTMVLLGAGALVLVVISVVATVYLLNRPAAPNPAAPAIAAPAASSSTTEPAIAPPVVVPPVVVAPITTPAPAPASEPATSGATTTGSAPEPRSPPIASAPPPSGTTAPIDAGTLPATSPPARATPSTASPPSTSANAPKAASASTPSAPTPNAIPAQPDERIIAYVESIRVMATRAAEGKVLMNDRFYRVNDIVERKLGVRLITVATESLTFADANGVTYVKYF